MKGYKAQNIISNSAVEVPELPSLPFPPSTHQQQNFKLGTHSIVTTCAEESNSFLSGGDKYGCWYRRVEFRFYLLTKTSLILRAVPRSRVTTQSGIGNQGWLDQCVNELALVTS
jgi:hypothetical protein